MPAVGWGCHCQRRGVGTPVCSSLGPNFGRALDCVEGDSDRLHRVAIVEPTAILPRLLPGCAADRGNQVARFISSHAVHAVVLCAQPDVAPVRGTARLSNHWRVPGSQLLTAVRGCPTGCCPSVPDFTTTSSLWWNV